jgi:2-keto-4-pentenoate hydratase/2-oxohepta-3-ene-1,7-dioic acid hydratase in catechol pathway
MRLATLLTDRGHRVAGVRADGYVDLQATDSQLPGSLTELLALGQAGRERAEQATRDGRTIASKDVSLLAPILSPEKVICIGLNYADHAAESGQAIPEEPVVFNKFPTSLTGPGQPISLPSVSAEVDYEAELVVVIGREGKGISESEALDYVGGYTCGHDVSARDWQLRKPGGQWLLGKTFDTFAPIGPLLVTADEIPNPGELGIALRLNGRTMQDSSTRQLIFSVPKLISYLSQVATLKPGDLIFTGTPPGVGAARKPPVFLQPGDKVEVEIEGIGVLENPVIAG